MWSIPQFSADLVTFTEEILNQKLHYCAVKVNFNLLDEELSRKKFITPFMSPGSKSCGSV